MSDSAIVIRISGDEKGLVKAVQVSEKQLQNFENVTRNVFDKINKSWLALGTKTVIFTTALKNVAGAIQSYIISPLSGAVNSFVQFGDQISKTSQRIGIGVESLGGLKFAAEQCGADFGTLTDALKTFQNQLGAAQTGDAGMIGKLGRAGIDASDFEGLDNESQLMKLADHIQAIGDRSEQTRVAMELFGDAGFKLLPFFQEGSSGIQKLVAEGKDVGAVLGTDAVTGAVNLADAMNRMKTSCANVSNLVMSQLAPAITAIMDGITGTTRFLIRFIDANQGLITVLSGAALGYGTLTAAMLIYNNLARIVTVTTKLLALAGKGLMAAWPVLALTAIATVFYLWSENARKAQEATDELIRTTHQQTEAVKAGLEADNKRFERLQELQKLSREDTLNNGEVEEANRLIKALTDKYGDLGIKINSVTGEIEGMTEAQAEMAKRQNEVRIRSLEAELLPIQNEIRRLDKYFADQAHSIVNLDSKETIEANGERYNELLAKRFALQGGIGLLKPQESEPSDFASEPSDSASVSDDDLEAQNKAARERQKQAKEKLADSKPDTDLMTDLEKSYSDLAGKVAEKYKRLDDEIALAMEAGETQRAEDLKKKYVRIAEWESAEREKIQAAEIARQDSEAAKEYQAWQSANPAQPELVALPASDPRLAGAQSSVENAQNAHAATVLTGDSGKIATAAEELRKAQVELAKTVAAASGEDRLKAREELAALQKEYADKKELGADNTTLNALVERITEAQKNVEENDAAYFNAVGQVEAGLSAEAKVEEAARLAETSRGTFSAFGVESAIGESSTQQRILDEVQKIRLLNAGFETLFKAMGIII